MKHYQYKRQPQEIYKTSFQIIRSEADLRDFTQEESRIVVRMIHACGQVEMARHIKMTSDFAMRARQALVDGAPIFCDTQMVARGITKKRLPAQNDVVCTINDPTVAEHAKEINNTRSAAAVDYWKKNLKDALVVIGNAPTALFYLLNRLGESFPKPAAIIGVPVGFVGAAESKEALMEIQDIPWLTVQGRPGGSAMAAAAVNALAREKEE